MPAFLPEDIRNFNDLEEFIQWLGDEKLEKVRQKAYLDHFGGQVNDKLWSGRKALFINNKVSNFIVGKMHDLNNNLKGYYDGGDTVFKGKLEDILRVESSKMMLLLGRLRTVVNKEIFDLSLVGDKSLRKGELKNLNGLLDNHTQSLSEMHKIFMSSISRESGNSFKAFLATPAGQRVIDRKDKEPKLRENITDKSEEGRRFQILFEYLQNIAEPSVRAEYAARLVLYLETGWGNHDLNLKTTHKTSPAAQALSKAIDHLGGQYDDTKIGDGYGSLTNKSELVGGIKPLLDARLAELMQEWRVPSKNESEDSDSVQRYYSAHDVKHKMADFTQNRGLAGSGVIDIVMFYPDKNGRPNYRKVHLGFATSLKNLRADRQWARHHSVADKNMQTLHGNDPFEIKSSTFCSSSAYLAEDVKTLKFSPILKQLGTVLNSEQVEYINMLTCIREILDPKKLDDVGKFAKMEILTFGAPTPIWNETAREMKQDYQHNAMASLEYAFSCLRSNVSLFSERTWTGNRQINLADNAVGALETFVNNTMALENAIVNKLVVMQGEKDALSGGMQNYAKTIKGIVADRNIFFKDIFGEEPQHPARWVSFIENDQKIAATLEKRHQLSVVKKSAKEKLKIVTKDTDALIKPSSSDLKAKTNKNKHKNK